MDLNELDFMCNDFSIELKDMEFELEKLRLKKEVLCNLKKSVECNEGHNRYKVELKKFFEKEQYGSKSAINVNFERDYSEFIKICKITQDLCLSLEVQYKFFECDADYVVDDVLIRGVTVVQHLYVRSLNRISDEQLLSSLDSVVKNNVKKLR